MNYKQLLKQLKSLTKEQLQQTVTIHIQHVDEYYAIANTDTTTEDDVLEEGHFFLVLTEKMLED
jgi:hypothetical protein